MTRQTQGQQDPFQRLASWDPFRTFGSMDPFRRMREMMSMDPFAEMSSVFPTTGRQFMPDMEVRETKDSYLICADLPGLREEDLQVDVSGNRLTISGKREEEQRDENERYWAYERSYGSFTRSFVLPEGVSPDHIDARLDSGVLEVRIPKAKGEEAKRIPVKGGAKLEQQGAPSGVRQVPAGQATGAGASQTGATSQAGQEIQGGAREKAA
jgi:HSP20 family protein